MPPRVPCPPEPRPGEIYFEFTRIGAFVKCTAIDATTGIEVSVQGPATASQRDLQTLARRRLERRLGEG